MKNLILLLAVFIFTAFTISAQVSSSSQSDAQKKEMEQKKMEEQKRLKEQEKAESQAENPNAPVIKFDKTVHDYGTIQQHGDGKCEFKFTNEGKEPLILSNVRSSCGCTVPTWPRQPVLPGQSEVIKVKYDTKRIGMINKSIHVYSNAKVSPLTLKIKGKVEAPKTTKAPTKEVDKTGAPVNK
jgi:hypothetical protein